MSVPKVPILVLLSRRPCAALNRPTLIRCTAFGDAQWTNKERLSDTLLKNLLEHFSSLCLDNAHCKADILGQAYEYLIKKFADLTNKKAGEFYTPRAVVALMIRILAPQAGETIYDPACGTRRHASGSPALCQGARRRRQTHAGQAVRAGEKPDHLRHCPNESFSAWRGRLSYRAGRHSAPSGLSFRRYACRF